MARVILTRPDGSDLEFDGWIGGTFSGSAVVTDHPIEDGSSVADHSQAEPRRITLQMKQTETPIEGAGVEGPYGPERVREAMRFLDAAGESGDPLDVSIPRIGLFELMVLESWPAEISVERAADFEIVLKQIEIAEALVVDVPVEAIAPASRAGQQPEADTGKQATEEKPVDRVQGDGESDVPPSILLDQGRALRNKLGI